MSVSSRYEDFVAIDKGGFSLVPGSAAKEERKMLDAPFLPGREFFPLKLEGQGLGKLHA